MNYRWLLWLAVVVYAAAAMYNWIVYPEYPYKTFLEEVWPK